MTGLIYRWDQPSQQVIECLREANLRLPDSHRVSYVLFRCFNLRFWVTMSIEDYENAMAILIKIVAPHSSTDSPSPYLAEALQMAAHLVRIRFHFYGNPEYLEEAIFCCRGYLSLISPEDPIRGDIIQILVELEKGRSDEFGITNSLPEAPSSNPGLVDPPSISDLSASLAESNLVNPSSITIQDHNRHLDAVCAMHRITDKADIEEAVKYCRLLFISLQHSPHEAMALTHLTLSKLVDFLLHAFKLTKKPEYLNESIDVHRGILKIPHAQWIHFDVILMLILSLISRINFSEDGKDVDEVIRLFHILVTNSYTKTSTRFEMSCQWARFARRFCHPSTPTA